ncbi:MAG TPA: hypothetical protein VEC43_05490 [Candidatus Acidoferrales bacterium]|nr:hypothetical protein [Candidatus Acidoferrales bacterium]
MSKKKDVSGDVPEYMKSLRKDMDSRLTDLKAELDDVQKKAAKTMKERPMLALGIAFLVGMAFGVALAKSGD